MNINVYINTLIRIGWEAKRNIKGHRETESERRGERRERKSQCYGEWFGDVNRKREVYRE